MTDIESWFRTMERLGSADDPIVTVGGVRYTPRQILGHARMNDQIWQQIKPQLGW